MKLLLIVLALCTGCSERKQPEPSGKTSHPAMPNQLEVGSTLDGRYRLVKKLGAVGDYDVYAAEHASIEKSYVVMAPSPHAGSGAGAALNDAAKRQTARGIAGEIVVDATGTTPAGNVYVVLAASDAQVAQLLSGSLTLGG